MLLDPLRAVNSARFLGTVSALVASGLLMSACGSSGAADRPPESGKTATSSEPVVSARESSTRECGDLGYRPRTDNGAFGIEATGVTCATARRVASRSQGLPASYEFRGFTCRNEGPQGELPSYPYTCVRGDDRITFSAS